MRILIILILSVCSISAHADTTMTWASYFTVESCKREGTSGIMANGYPLRDDLLVCASWDYPLNSILRVTNMKNKKSVIVYVGDRGPNWDLYDKGRRLDLGKRPFEQISNLKEGVIVVLIEQITRG